MNPLIPLYANALAFVPLPYIISFDQNWHHLYSNYARGKDVSNDTQIKGYWLNGA